MADVLSLPWLLPAPADFRSRVRSLKSAESVATADVVALAAYGLDLSQLGSLGKIVDARREALRAEGRLRPVLLGVAATHTVDLVAEALPATALRHGLLVDTVQTDYGQLAQAVLDPASSLAQAKPDFVLLALDAASLGLARPQFEAAAAHEAVQSALDYVASLRDGVRANIGAGVVLHTLAPPAESLFGSYDARVPGSVRWLIARFNQRLAEEIAGDSDLLLDMAALAETVGLARWHDPLRWHDAKIPCALDAVPLYADHVARLLASARGLARKCLVLDLDNTLWGGIIGDDGVDGIKLGQGSAKGEAHLAVQSLALDLRRRGIILAVCSKNEEAAALIPFREHDEMVLKEDHISVFVANWTDKATNLKAIAQALNIGTDALVFLDDNPAERERVRQELPEVAVPEVGDEPSDYVRLLSLAGYFEAVAFNDEDRKRADMYQANAQRASALQKVGNLDEYLASLGMECTIAPFDDLGRARIAQLINKSNQFNLTTRRYTEADVAAIQADPDKFTMQVRLVDRFGDNGMISVVIFDRAAEAWHCDTWLMSCRVLGRRVEEAVLAHVAEAAKAAGARQLTGEYIPTPKNVLVEKHFEKLGFTHAADREGGGTLWALDLSEYSLPDLPMQIDAKAQDQFAPA
jgi:FkbH-like protein